MAKIIYKGLVKADSIVLQSGFTTRFFVTSNKSTKRGNKEDELKKR